MRSPWIESDGACSTSESFNCRCMVCHWRFETKYRSTVKTAITIVEAAAQKSELIRALLMVFRQVIYLFFALDRGFRLHGQRLDRQS